MKVNQAHLKDMKKAMTFCVDTKGLGIFVNPERYWNGKVDNNYDFEVLGISEFD